MKGRRNKYGNVPCEAMGHKFASIGERGRFFYLLARRKDGDLENLRLQVPFPLDINLERAVEMRMHICTYVADFVYDVRALDGERRTVVEDYKGYVTREFAHKRRLMKGINGVDIHLVAAPSDPIGRGNEGYYRPDLGADRKAGAP